MLGSFLACSCISCDLSPPLCQVVVMWRRGERGFSGSRFRGPYQDLSSQARLVPTKTKTEEAEAKPRTSQAKTSTSKDKGTSRTKDKARQGKPRQAQAKFKLQEETLTCLRGGDLAGTILFFLNLFFLWEGLLLATCLSMPPKVPPRGPSRHYLYQDRRGGERTPVKAFQTSCQVFLGGGKRGDGLKTLLHVLAALGGGWGTAAT